MYGWVMPQKLPVNDFKCIEDISEFDECFLKGYCEERDKGYFLEVNIQFLENLHNFHNNLPFTIFTWKTENWESRKSCI